jgi:hypothetical protein
MERRKFFKTGTQAALAGFAGIKMNASSASFSGSVPRPRYDLPEILKSYTTADHRKRLENIAFSERRVFSCVRKHLITGYIPGHAVISPTNSNWEPDHNDEQALANLRDIGIGIIQPWSSWATCWGKNYLIAKNPDGFKRFVKLGQSYGLKVIPYTSSQFFERTDKNFKEEWAWPKAFDLVESDYHLAHCSPASPDWRAYVTPRHLYVMDEYGVDGLYNDLGYVRPGEQADFYRPPNKRKYADDDVIAFEEGSKKDGALSDFLALMYAEVKRRGGIYKLHKEGIDTVYTDMKVYDYLWVGEANNDIDFVRESTKNYEPYVTPQRLITTSAENENESFLNSIPYMQFPIIGHGQAGEQGNKYVDTFKYWFNHYRLLTEEGSWVWIDICSSELFQSLIPKNCVASLFVNRKVYLVIANFNNKEVKVITTDNYVSVIKSKEQTQEQNNWVIKGRSIEILELVSSAVG